MINGVIKIHVHQYIIITCINTIPSIATDHLSNILFACNLNIIKVTKFTNYIL